MKTICLIIPYFGEFKPFFQLFLNSCSSNSSIDWLIYTDNNKEYVWPKNVKKIECSFEEFRERIQSIFDFKIELSTPYKLCDYKPAYGEALASDIQAYDFWGFCDCDLIWGDIRAFVTDEILDKYDRIFTRGHLSIFRNNKIINSYYRTQKYYSYREVYSSVKSYAFDEWGGTSKAWEEDDKLFYDDLVMDDVMSFYDGFRVTKSLSGYGSPYHKKNQDLSKNYKRMKSIVYFIDNGKLYRYWIENNKQYYEEVCYVHFQKRNIVINNELLDKPKYVIAKNTLFEAEAVSNVETQHTVVGNTLTFNNMKLDVKRFIAMLYHRVK